MVRFGQGCRTDTDCAAADPIQIPFDRRRLDTLLTDPATGSAIGCTVHDDCHVPGGTGRTPGFSCLFDACRAIQSLDDPTGAPVACSEHADCTAPGFGCYFGSCMEVIDPTQWTFTRCDLPQSELAVASVYDLVSGDLIQQTRNQLISPGHLSRDDLGLPACPEESEFAIGGHVGANGLPVRAELAIRARLPSLDGNAYCSLDLNADGTPLDPGEECIVGGDALALGCPGGGLADCDPDTCLVDWTSCTTPPATCLDGVVDPAEGEQCEPGQPPVTCADVGLPPAFVGAQVPCASNCMWDRRACSGTGNVDCSSTTECTPDTPDDPAAACANPAPGAGPEGTQRPCVTNSCLFDDGVCGPPPVAACGDGLIDPTLGEQCDPGVAFESTCGALGLVGGRVACHPLNCTWIRTQCRSLGLASTVGVSDWPAADVGFGFTADAPMLTQRENTTECDIDPSSPCCHPCIGPVPLGCAPDVLVNGCAARHKWLRVVALPRRHDTWEFNVLGDAAETDPTATPLLDAVGLGSVEGTFDAAGALLATADLTACPQPFGPQVAYGTTVPFGCLSSEGFLSESTVTGPFLDGSRGSALAVTLAEVATVPLPPHPLTDTFPFALQANVRRGTTTPADTADPNFGTTFDVPQNLACQDTNWCRLGWNQATRRFEGTDETWRQMLGHLGKPVTGADGAPVPCSSTCAIGSCSGGLCVHDAESFVVPGFSTSLTDEWGHLGRTTLSHYDVTITPQTEDTDPTTGAGDGFTPPAHCPAGDVVEIDTSIPTLAETQVVILLQASESMGIADPHFPGSRLDAGKNGVLAWLQSVADLPSDQRPLVSMRTFAEEPSPNAPFWFVSRLFDADDPGGNQPVDPTSLFGAPNTVAEYVDTFLVPSNHPTLPETPTPAGTASLEPALLAALDAFFDTGSAWPNRRILLVTDGMFVPYALPPNGIWDVGSLVYAAALAAANWTILQAKLPQIDVVFVGHAYSTLAPQQLAYETGGSFYHAQKDEDVIPAIFQTMGALQGEDFAADYAIPPEVLVDVVEAGPIPFRRRSFDVEAGATKLTLLHSIPSNGVIPDPDTPLPPDTLPVGTWRDEGYRTLTGPSGALSPHRILETDFHRLLIIDDPEPGPWRFDYFSGVTSVHIAHTSPKCYASTRHGTYHPDEAAIEVIANAAWREPLGQTGVTIDGSLHRPDGTQEPLSFEWDEGQRKFKTTLTPEMKRGHGAYRVVAECKVDGNAFAQSAIYREAPAAPGEPPPPAAINQFSRQTSLTFYWLGSDEPPLPSDPLAPNFGDADGDRILDQEESELDLDKDGISGVWDSNGDGDTLPDAIDPDPLTPESLVSDGFAGFIANDGLMLESGARIVTPGGSFAQVANFGAGETFYGPSAETGGLLSTAPIVLSSTARVHGSIVKTGSLSRDPASIIAGKVVTVNALNVLDLHPLAVDIPFSTQPVVVSALGSATLQPGVYGTVEVRNGATLSIGPGIHYMQELLVDPMASVSVDSSAGGVYLYVQERLGLQGTITFQAGGSNGLLIGYMGTGTVLLERQFAGNVLAPFGRLTLGSLGDPTAAHRGTFLARLIDVEVDTTVIVDGFLHAVVPEGTTPGQSQSCSDGLRNQGESDVDCGGPCGATCLDGDSCLSEADCVSGICAFGLCDLDTDGDGVLDSEDNCVFDANLDQLDQDDDGLGNACDPDLDGDGIANEPDNCPLAANPSQSDFDLDGLGDACDDNSLVANAGPDQIKECTGNGKASVTLDGSDSGGPSGSVTFKWTAPVFLSGPTQPIATGTFPVGSSTVTLKVSQGAVFKTDTALVTVRDTAAPNLTVPANITSSTCSGVNIGQASAVDSCGGPVTITHDAPSSFKAGVYSITWRASDQYGNVATRTQRVTIGLGDSASCCPTGTNVIQGTSNNDALNGTSGRDCMLGKGAQDTIKGFGGDDLLSGGEGDDLIEGGDGNDLVQGGSGQDVLRGGAGSDSVFGDDGDDQCWGGSQDDLLSGGQGQDRLYGEDGNDALSGESGDDRLEGASGSDLLDGGSNHDTCLGGSGANTLLSCEMTQ